MATRAERRHASVTSRSNLKIVVTGPFAAGKTTFIRTISEITVLATERGVTDATRARKSETTVAMDHGRITIDRDLVLTLFGTPGQDRFDFMWDVLSEGMLGYVLLLDGSSATAAEDTLSIRRAFALLGPDVPFVVAVNQRPVLTAEDTEVLRRILELGDDVPVVETDALDKDSVKEVLLQLLHRVHETVHQPLIRLS